MNRKVIYKNASRILDYLTLCLLGDYMKFVIVAILLVLSSSAFANSGVVLECSSYSTDYDLKVTVTRTSAIVDVLKSLAQGDRALQVGKIELNSRIELTRGWVGYDGRAIAGNHVMFKAKESDLARSGRMTAYLWVSPKWTDTYSVYIQLDCILR